MLSFVKTHDEPIRPRSSLHDQQHQHSNIRRGNNGQPHLTIVQKTSVFLYILVNLVLLIAEHSPVTVSDTSYRTSSSHHHHCNSRYDINYYTNNMSIDLTQNVIHFNVSIMYNFHSSGFCKKSGYKSIGYVVNTSTDIQNVQYYPNKEVYSFSMFQQKNYYYVNYYFTRGWFWSDTRHLVQFSYDLSLDHMCKADDVAIDSAGNRSEFELPLPWITHWVDYSPSYISVYNIDLYANSSVFGNTTFSTDMNADYVRRDRMTDGLYYYGFSVFGTQSKQFVISGDTTENNEIFDGEHRICASCDRLRKLGKDQSLHLQWLWWLILFPVGVAGMFMWIKYRNR